MARGNVSNAQRFIEIADRIDYRPDGPSKELLDEAAELVALFELSNGNDARKAERADRTIEAMLLDRTFPLILAEQLLATQHAAPPAAGQEAMAVLRELVAAIDFAPIKEGVTYSEHEWNRLVQEKADRSITALSRARALLAQADAQAGRAEEP